MPRTREVLAVADTVSVLRGGRLVAGPVPRDGADEKSIAGMIVGRDTAASVGADDSAALVGTTSVGTTSVGQPRLERRR